MYSSLLKFLSSYGFQAGDWEVNAIIFGLIVLTVILIHIILHGLIFRIIIAQLKKSPRLLLQAFGDKSLFKNIAYCIQSMLLSMQFRVWLLDGSLKETLISVSDVFALFFGLMALFSLLNIIQNYMLTNNVAKQFPIGGIVQTIKLISSLALIIILISMVLGKSPTVLISGLGAMTAVLMLVFKDPILGFVAGIQLSANNMLRIGDWLEMPKYHADGSVVDIGLTTVKVRNWDNTITTVPTYALISDSFKNWRAMSESGGRRIKRSIFIDTNSVHFLSQKEIEHLSQSRLLTQYLTDRVAEVKAFNEQNEITTDSYLNGRHLTNIGTFRIYLENYLRNNPQIHKNMTLMVRQLQPTDKGIPMEIYCFTNTVAWLEYEAIQADIFDHIFAVAPEFGISLYQAPSGQDFKAFAR
ncbi:mechanosensitive ion channel family protein [Basilea psittacipulmonis]|uniref:Mechanosensing system component YbdG n=1 Tax=Basilea psittacipulmonis DSM 24701 TaxID=1072685 RepID=A0A077DE97_9BURK|nr:mechanosensitive ion channel domain-containing protein [Basilea psittacipulmonis]AIL32491.1 miniconductance mechanosensitive channel [Basilea psittacipulmonis DSM 24701]